MREDKIMAVEIKAKGLVCCRDCGRYKVDHMDMEYYPMHDDDGSKTWLCEYCKAQEETRINHKNLSVVFKPEGNFCIKRPQK
jgi:hypothetical protein